MILSHPQRIPHLKSFSAYTGAFRWNKEDSGVHRDVILEVFIAEGIPAFKGYLRLMSNQPMNERKIGFDLNPSNKNE